MSNPNDGYLAGLQPANNVAFPIADATAIVPGDHVKLSSGLIVQATVAADDANLIGIAVEKKEANVPAPSGKITIALLDGISRYVRTLSAPATVAVGATLEIAGAQTLVPGSGDPVAVCVEGGTSVSTVTVIYKKSQVI